METKKVFYDYTYTGVKKKVLQDASKELTRYVEHMAECVRFLSGSETEIVYDQKESSIALPFDNRIVSSARELARYMGGGGVKVVVVVGIGGSNLGTKAIYDALRGRLDFLTEKTPKLFFLDTIDAEMMHGLVRVLEQEITSKDEMVVNVISKSGKTIETIANFETLHFYLSRRFGNILDRIVVTADSDSMISVNAAACNIATLAVPKLVGGRFSVFSSVGVFPLLLAGIDVAHLLDGARAAVRECTSGSFHKNPAVISSATLYAHYLQERRIHNTFLFNPLLESLGKWYSQLVGESLGKRVDREGQEVRTGITPLVSIGTTDLHSVGQLYFGGPDDKFTTFVYGKDATHSDNVAVPNTLLFDEDGYNIAGRRFSDIYRAIFDGVKVAYKEAGLPFAEIGLHKIDEFGLGWFMQMKMVEVMYLAYLFNIDAFDQPEVERYKEHTRKILHG